MSNACSSCYSLSKVHMHDKKQVVFKKDISKF